MAFRLGQLSDGEKRQLVAFTQAEADRASSNTASSFGSFPRLWASEAEPGLRERADTCARGKTSLPRRHSRACSARADIEFAKTLRRTRI
jgi:hypothetical protein